MVPSGIWLIVGLGNPGERYRYTRHNLGIWALDCFAKIVNSTSWRRTPPLVHSQAQFHEATVHLIKPTVWMNRSGIAVAEAVGMWNVSHDHTVVVCDDVALPDGRLRMRLSGSAGGHKGLLSVIQYLGTEAFPRLRIGVGSEREDGHELRDYVLDKLSKEEIELYSRSAADAAEALRMMIEKGFGPAMTVYNQDLRHEAGSGACDGNTSPNPGGAE